MFLLFNGNLFNRNRITRIFVDKNYNNYLDDPHRYQSSYSVHLEISDGLTFGNNGESAPDFVSKRITASHYGEAWQGICYGLVKAISAKMYEDTVFDVDAWINEAVSHLSIGERYNLEHDNKGK